jgi:hypothetical protein
MKANEPIDFDKLNLKGVWFLILKYNKLIK